MSIKEFEFCDFSTDVITHLLEKEPFDGTVFVFPNENSKKKALRIFQQQWDFSDTRFLTIEELKGLLYLTQKSLLREEKRTLAFYAVLSTEDKKVFRVHSYFQAIELAHQFFTLWEEFNDECVPDKILDTLIDGNLVDILDWQIENFNRLLEIKARYKAFITEKGFDDLIFVRNTDNPDSGFLEKYDRFVFANQFYYTNLEKNIIKQLEQLDKQVVLYYQLPEKLLDQESLNIQPFGLHDLTEAFAVENINITECANDFSMILSMSRTLDSQKIKQIIDPAFNRNPYSAMVSPEKFNLGESVSFTQSSIYRFFTALYTALNSIIYEEKQKKYLLPVDSILSAVLVPGFVDYFVPSSGDSNREHILNVLYGLLDREYKYLDMDTELNTFVKDEQVLALSNTLVVLLEKMARLKSLTEWIDFIDSEAGIRIKQIVSRHEKEHSTILDVFYRLLADLESIESIGIVTDWDTYLNVQNPNLMTYKTGAGLLRIILDYMKAKTWQWNTEPGGSRIEITNLNDTRNIAYESVAVLNVMEGKIPSQRLSPFLFTDQQRKHMGLKIYDDIRLREQYYFYRMVLASKNVYLYTQKNIENNVQVSSFVEELMLNFDATVLQYTKDQGYNYKPVYDTILDCADYKVDRKKIYSPEFYRIPLDVKTDYPDSRIRLSYTSFRDLKTNPFLYFVRSFCRIDEKPKTVERDFSARLIGNIAHDVATECWRLMHPQSDDVFAFDAPIERELVMRAIQNVVRWSKYYYSILHDYTFSYFEYITAPNLADGLLGFFDLLTEQGLFGKSLVIMPEEEEGTAAERRYKTFLPAEQNVLELDFQFRGRADLRIFDPDDEVNYIFDFKTGQFEKEQLIIYEQFYHLLEEPEKQDAVSSWFYQVLKKEKKELLEYITARSKQKTKQDLFDAFAESLIEIASKLNEQGFSLAEQKSKLQYMPDITRKDLYLAQNFTSGDAV